MKRILVRFPVKRIDVPKIMPRDLVSLLLTMGFTVVSFILTETSGPLEMVEWMVVVRYHIEGP
jgi:hypothetical protein